MASQLQQYVTLCVCVCSVHVGYPFEKVVSRNLCLQVFDHDRFSKDDIIGEVVMPLTPENLCNGQTLWKYLEPSAGRTVRLYTVGADFGFEVANRGTVRRADQ